MTDLCGDPFCSCHCDLPLGHDGAHECHGGLFGCGGSWTDEGDIVALPLLGRVR